MAEEEPTGESITQSNTLENMEQNTDTETLDQRLCRQNPGLRLSCIASAPLPSLSEPSLRDDQ